MLNARLFTSALPIFLFVRDKPVLACQGNSFRGRGKSTSCTRVHTFFCAHPPRRQSRRLRRGWRVIVDITWGLRGAVACPVSRRGIARDISSLLALPLAKKSGSAPTNDHRRDQQVATKVQHEVNPSRYPHHAPLSSPGHSPLYLPAT